MERRLWGRRCEAPELQGLAWNRGPRATLRLHWARESISGVSQAEPALERGWRKPLLPLTPVLISSHQRSTRTQLAAPLN